MWGVISAVRSELLLDTSLPSIFNFQRPEPSAYRNPTRQYCP